MMLGVKGAEIEKIGGIAGSLLDWNALQLNNREDFNSRKKE